MAKFWQIKRIEFDFGLLCLLENPFDFTQLVSKI